MGKIPIKIWRITLAPALGMEYRIITFRTSLEKPKDLSAGKYLNPYKDVATNTDFNTWAIKFGGFVDFDLSERWYLRANILGMYGITSADGLLYEANYDSVNDKSLNSPDRWGAQFQVGVGRRF